MDYDEIAKQLVSYGITAFIATITCLSAQLENRQTKRSQNIIKALKAVSKAEKITRRYYEKNKKEDYETQTNIGNKWREAAILVGEVEPELGQILYNKSLYWFNGAYWSKETIRDTKIGLDTINTLVSSVLVGKEKIIRKRK